MRLCNCLALVCALLVIARRAGDHRQPLAGLFAGHVTKSDRPSLL